MAILNRRGSNKDISKKEAIPETKIPGKKVVVKKDMVPVKKIDDNKSPLLTLFPGGAGKKKDNIQIDPDRVEALKKWRDEELKGYKVSIPDSTVKNPSYLKVAQALIDCDGFVMRAAIRLRVTYNKLNRIIKENPKLRGIVQDSNEAFVDLAENKLKDAVLAGNMTAIVFTLKNKGANRGWRDEDGVKSISDEKPVAFNYNLRLPKNCRLVSEEGVEIYRDDSKKAEEIKEVSNG